ncbi:hypothetical protein [Parasphingorhabdus sp. NYA22]
MFSVYAQIRGYCAVRTGFVRHPQAACIGHHIPGEGRSLTGNMVCF